MGVQIELLQNVLERLQNAKDHKNVGGQQIERVKQLGVLFVRCDLRLVVYLLERSCPPRMIPQKHIERPTKRLVHKDVAIVT